MAAISERAIENVKARDRARGQNEYRKELNRKRYKLRMETEEGRLKNSLYKKRWREKNKVKRATHILIGNLLRQGKIIRQPCERCGKAESEAHHEDYSKPLDITWLCPKHHGERHRELNELKRKNKK